MLIPKNHPRAESLFVREKLVEGFENGLVAKEGLMAHGRGETFDYLLGEKTSKSAKLAIKEAARLLISSDSPVISVNGNFAVLCPKEIVKLAKVVKGKIEVNLFYYSKKRKEGIAKFLKKNGAKEVFGTRNNFLTSIPNLKSARRIVDKDGIYSSNVILVPLEDGDRTLALKKMGKKVITFDINPLSRTAQTADITIVDNVVRGMKELLEECRKLSKRNHKTKRTKKFANKKNLSDAIFEIKKNLVRRANHAEIS